MEEARFVIFDSVAQCSSFCCEREQSARKAAPNGHPARQVFLLNSFAFLAALREILEFRNKY